MYVVEHECGSFCTAAPAGFAHGYFSQTKITKTASAGPCDAPQACVGIYRLAAVDQYRKSRQKRCAGRAVAEQSLHTLCCRKKTQPSRAVAASRAKAPQP